MKKKARLLKQYTQIPQKIPVRESYSMDTVIACVTDVRVGKLTKSEMVNWQVYNSLCN